MEEKYKKIKKIVRILYASTSLILACVAFSALIGLLADWSHMMNACVVSDYIYEDIGDIIMMSFVCLFFGSSALMGILHDV